MINEKESVPENESTSNAFLRFLEKYWIVLIVFAIFLLLAVQYVLDSGSIDRKIEENAKKRQLHLPIQVDGDKKYSLIYSESFTEPLQNKNIIPSMVRNGRLCLDGIHPETVPSNHPLHGKFQANRIEVKDLDPGMFTYSAYYYINSEKAGTMLVKGDLLLKLVNGRLSVINNKRYYDIGFVVPIKSWFNITMTYDRKDGVLTFFSNETYITTIYIGTLRNYITFDFYEYDEPVIDGRVDRIHIYNGINPYAGVLK